MMGVLKLRLWISYRSKHLAASNQCTTMIASNVWATVAPEPGCDSNKCHSSHQLMNVMFSLYTSKGQYDLRDSAKEEIMSAFVNPSFLHFVRKSESPCRL